MMLQRAASNAYSWWWASHIRTKQSKWLEQNLQDMEEKVAYTLKLIEEDGDSFAKRAEMYYKKRPELISFVEESYRAYRALAERYDHISTELQNANNTIASVFPEQVPYSIDDDDEETPRMQSRTAGMTPKGNIPKVPKIPAKDMRSFLSSPSKKLRPSKSTKKPKTASVVKSGLSQPEGLEEIDKLQKQILALQTEKEFVKSAYESRMEKYWEIENQMREVQEKVYNLQDEFGTGIGIESDDARTLMAASALKSCQETLTELQVKQERSAEEVKTERQRINNAREKLESLKDEFLSGEAIQKKPSNKDGDSLKQMKQVLEDKSAENKLELLQQKIESIESLSVTEMAEKIDEVVNQVVSLENEVLSQSTLIQRLRRENDELQSQIRSLEDDTATLVNGKNDLSNKVAELEGKLHGLQDFSQTVEDKSNNLQTNFTEAKSSLSQLSDKLQYVKPDEEVDGSSQKEEKPQNEAKLPKQFAGQEGAAKTDDGIKRLQSENSIKRVEATQSTKTDKSDEEPKVPNLIQKEEKPTTELKSIEESVKQENKQNHGDDKVKVVDIASSNAHDSIPAEKKEPATPLQKSGEQITQDNLDYGKEKSKEQEASSVDNNGDVSKATKRVNRETKDDTKHHVHFASPRSQGEVDNQPGCNIKDTSGEEDINNMLSVGRNEDATEEKADEPNWKEMFMKGMEDKEKILLTEYTAILRNYKELKRKMSDSSEANIEINNDSSDVALQLKELKIANAKKDEEIKSLLQKLGNLQTCFGDNNNVEAQLAEKRETMAETSRTESTESEINARLIQVVEQNLSTSPVEEKFRMSIDELLEENLDFWLRFSTSFHQVQKFETEVKDLQAEVTKLEEKHKKQEGSNSMKYSLRSDGRPLFRHLTEIQTELSVWMEKCALLKEELKSRFSSLCSIQEEITMALKVSAEDDDFTFTSYQAAKFQGEVLNMKQENNKVADELQAGLDHVTNLQLEVEKSLNILSEKFGLSTDASKGHLEHSSSKSRVPLQSFIFGPKPKKKSSFFSCVHPALHRKYNGLRSGLK